MRNNILAGLSEIEASRNLTVLYACESGSRAWGFASPDSDYDVRGIFVYPQSKYLSIRQAKDTVTVDLPGDLDISLWDIRKALSHILKSNATLFEWLQSPIVYTDHRGFRDRLWEMREVYFSPRAAMHHYLGIAKGVLERRGEDQIRIKQYFYILRPLFAANWISQFQTPPSVLFSELLEAVDLSPKLEQLIQELWEKKVNAKEKDSIPLIPELEGYIVREWQRLNEKTADFASQKGDSEPLDELFRLMLTN